MKTVDGIEGWTLFYQDTVAPTDGPTPFPWTTSRYTKGTEPPIPFKECATLTVRAHGVDLAYMNGQWGEHVAKANARLICAAPVLLNVLQLTAENIRSLGPAGALSPFEPYTQWLDVVTAAIELATVDQQFKEAP